MPGGLPTPVNYEAKRPKPRTRAADYHAVDKNVSGWCHQDQLHTAGVGGDPQLVSKTVLESCISDTDWAAPSK
jgi:hypothetical protein